MPIIVSATTGGTSYASPFVGPTNHVVHVKVDLSGLTTDEVDANGYLKPGVPLTSAGILVAAGAVFGVTVEATRLPVTVPPTNTTLAAETADCLVAIATHGIVCRDAAEDDLGRAYTAAEIAGFAAAGSRLTLTTT